MVVAVPLVNRCMQPGSFARNRIYSNLHADPPSPRIPWLPAGCCMYCVCVYVCGQPILTYVIKCSTVKEDSKTSLWYTRAQRPSNEALHVVGINLHFVILTFRISYDARASLRYGKEVTLFTDQRSVSDVLWTHAGVQVKLYNASRIYLNRLYFYSAQFLQQISGGEKKIFLSSRIFLQDSTILYMCVTVSSQDIRPINIIKCFRPEIKRVIDRLNCGWYSMISSYNGDFIWICVQTRLTTGSSPSSSFSYPGGMAVFSVDRSSPGRLDPYLFAVKCTGINERRARCTSTIHGAEKPSRRYGVWASSFSPGPFLTGTFLWPTFSPRRRPRRHPLYPPRGHTSLGKKKKKKLPRMGTGARARRKQEPAGNDYL